MKNILFILLLCLSINSLANTASAIDTSKQIKVLGSVIKQGGKMVCTGTPSSIITTYPMPSPRTSISHVFTLSGTGNTNIYINPANITNATCKDNMGVANFTLTGSNSSTGFWYDQTGANYIWTTLLEDQMKALNIPLSRSYNIYFEAGAEFHGLDMLYNMCVRNNIPTSKVIVCLEPAVAGSTTVVSSTNHARAVQYSIDHGYNFKYWEIGNEPQYAWGSGLEYPLTYAAHVVACYNAMKVVDPSIIIGCQICRRSWYSEQVLSNIQGKADFIAPHWYGGQTNLDNYSTTEMILADNWKMLDYTAFENSEILTRTGKVIPQIDTEYRLLVAGTEGGVMTTGENGNKNGNIVGTLYDAVRMIYSIRDNYTQGMCEWHSMGSQPGALVPAGYYAKGDGTFPLADGKTSYMYWLYYYMNRHIGDNVINFTGTSPSFTGNAIHNVDDGSTGNLSYTGPLTPTIVTSSANGNDIYMVVVNPSSGVITCPVTFTNFVPTTSTYTCLSDPDITKSWIQTDNSTFISSQDISYFSATHTSFFSMPPMSVNFIHYSK